MGDVRKVSAALLADSIDLRLIIRTDYLAVYVGVSGWLSFA